MIFYTGGLFFTGIFAAQTKRHKKEQQLHGMNMFGYSKPYKNNNKASCKCTIRKQIKRFVIDYLYII